jgi:hypothetical protein
MRTKAETDSEEAEKRVRDIRRATRRQYSAEEKIRIVIGGCAVRTASLSCAARKTLTRIFTCASQKPCPG